MSRRRNKKKASKGQQSNQKPGASEAPDTKGKTKLEPDKPEPPRAPLHEADAVISVSSETAWEHWPALKDIADNPVRLPYDSGGIPLPLLILYMVFLTFGLSYMANWLVPDLLTYFFSG
jgi:hypothetical protein